MLHTETAPSIEGRYRAELRRHRRELVPPISILTIFATGLVLFYDSIINPDNTRWHIILALLMLPIGWGLSRWFWWAGWIIVARMVVVATYYRPITVDSDGLVYYASYLLAPIMATQLYGRHGTIGAVSLQGVAVLARAHLDGIGLLSMNNVVFAALYAGTFTLLLLLVEGSRAQLMRGLVETQVALHHAYDQTLLGWASALQLRDNETGQHSHRVVELTVATARHMGIAEEQLTHIRRGAILHDIGKIGVPDAILNKPGSLDPHEWRVMQMHPIWARELLEPIAYLKPALPIPWCHHERWDGSGYPMGSAGRHIPLEARIFAVVDVYDAMTSDRPYRKGSPPQEVIAYIQQQAGILFDPQVVAVFLVTLGDWAALQHSEPVS